MAQHKTSLRKVGGSVMLAVPRSLLDQLELRPGASLVIEVDGGRLIVDPHIKPRYTLSDLLDASDYTGHSQQDKEDETRGWTNDSAVGGELI